jgi:hypothetical protein
VGVAHGTKPVVGVKVNFDFDRGGECGGLTPLHRGETNEEGIASCEWILGPYSKDAKPRVKATLQGARGLPVQTPIYFNASFKETGGMDPTYLDELRADGVVRVNGDLGFAYSTKDAILSPPSPPTVTYETGVAYVGGQRFDITSRGTKPLDDDASPQWLYVNSNGDVVLDTDGGDAPPGKYALIAEFSTSRGKVVRGIDRRFDLTHLDEKVRANRRAIAARRADRRQFVPLLASTLPNLSYRDGRNYVFETDGQKQGFVPAGLAFDGQAIWVAGDKKIAWIDAIAPGPLKLLNDPVPPIPPIPPTSCAAFDGDTHVWFASKDERGTIILVDKNDHKETARLTTSPGSLVAIALAGDYMWVANQTRQTLNVMSVHSQQVLPIEIKLGCQPTCLAYDGQNLWIGGGELIYMLLDANCSEGWDAGAVVPIPNLTLPGAVLDLAFDGSHMWYATTGGIGKINVLTQRHVTMPSQCPNGLGLIFDGCHMWVAGEDVLYKVDTEVGVKLGDIVLPWVKSHGAFDGTHLWVAAENSVRRILVG